MSKQDSYEPIRLLEIELGSQKETWLRAHGWEERCAGRNYDV
jgi:hypothetical protein